MKLQMCLGLLMAIGMAQAAPVDEVSRSIQVTGTAVTRVAPDIVSWRITVQDQGSVAEAKAGNERKTQAVLALIRELGVAPEDVQTSYLNLEQQYDKDLLPRRVSLGWLMSRTIRFKQRDLSRFDEFIGRLLEVGDMEVGYALESSRFLELRKETRLKAVIQAREKAEALCSALGANLGEVTSIREHQFPFSDRSNAAFTISSPDEVTGDTTMAPGLIDISESVEVCFEIAQ